MSGKTIDQLTLGDTAEFTKTVSESDIYLFAGLTGDLNPAHINEAYAEKTLPLTLRRPSWKNISPLISRWTMFFGFLKTVDGKNPLI